MEVYVIRHGTTDWNKECRFQGTKDIELNLAGRKCAGELGKRLSLIDFDYIFSSPLIRAYETACLIRGYKSTQIIRNDLIKEISFGDLEGVPHKDWMNTDEPRKFFFSEPEKYVPPKNGETFISAMNRTKEFAQTIIEPLYKENPNLKIMIVAHGAILAALMCYLENRTVKNYWGKGLKGNCEETIYSYDGKNWSLLQDNSPQENPYIKSITQE